MSGQSFVQRFEAQVDQRREAPAVTFGERSLGYAELDARANSLARQLVAQGVTPDSVVAIAFERSLEAVVALLAVLKAGACYLPLDPGYPAERLAFMLEDARPALVLKQRGLALPGETAVAQIDFVLEGGVPTGADAERLPARHSPESLAYAIYTSGSTGKPKGVAMIHGALDNLIDWQLKDSIGNTETSTLQFAPLSFDVHFQEIFSTWCSGGRLVLVEERLRLEMLRLLELIERENIARIFLPFIALQSLADIAVAHGRLPRTLREVITAGEQLQITRALTELFTALPEAKLYNHYGPSETHVVTSHELTGAPSTWPALPPIGVALPNVELAVLREDGSVVAKGEEGELFLGGVALARGYLYRPELTAERFVTLGQNSGQYAGRRFYKTGDLVKELPDGPLQFLGRLDGQVKVRGYRIELGEIEVALSAHPSVKEAAVAVREPKPGDKRIIAWVVMEGAESPAVLREFLQGRLPEYMLPSAFVALPSLPRTPSGKVDKRSLPSPNTERPALASDYAPASTDTERKLLEIWEDVLGVQGIGANDNFFELGGNSLLALRVAAAAERALGQRLPIVQFFEYPTIAGQAAYLADPSGASGKARRVVKRDRGASAPIAVIGMAGRFPGADSVRKLWQNLEAGLESVATLSAQALAAVPAQDRDDPAYVPVRGIVNGAEFFDAAFFGVSPAEAAVLDPQQRLLLELSWHALEDAGYGPKTGDAIVGVYAGTHNNSYYLNAVLQHPEAIGRVGAFTTMVASEKDYVATRIANKLDLTGPALSIHTACSTSLVAIATAVLQLRAGLCDVALAGGAALSVPQETGHVYQDGGMLSRDGHTRTFDADATGTLFSDGAAMVALKPLEDALAAGDHIYAVIRGVGVNNDGGLKASFTAPSVKGQAAVIQMALEDAGVNAREIQYVEAHGTATPVGDPIEVEALTQAYRAQTADKQYCGIGSVKSNFGHLTAAAGVTGLIKVALSLENDKLPASLHYRAPNPKISFGESPFFVVDSARAWPRGQAKRLAGLSSFGVGGTNAHAILEEAPPAAASGPSIAPQLLLLSARTEGALERGSHALAEHLAARSSLPLADVAYTLALGRTPFAERRAIMATSVEEAVNKLRSASDGARNKAAASAPRLAFMFPGQGAQYVDMGRNLYESEALFRLTVDECAELLRPRLGRDLREVLYPKVDRDAARAELKRTEITQSALFTIEYALAKTLMAWGVEPSCFIGHSVGEFVAACLAGVFELEAALGLVAARGQLMQRMPSGSMLSVRDSAENVARYLPADLDLAAENGPGLCVVGGPTAAAERFQAELASRDIAAKLLETSHAFHSRSMDEAVVLFAEEVRKVRLSAPKLRIVSTATGTWLTDAEACDPGYWSSHLRRTVRFVTALKTLNAEGPFTLLEVGPRKTLTTLSLQRLPGDTSQKPTAIACLNDKAEDDGEWKPLLEALGRLWTLGSNVDWQAFFRAEKRRRVPLPGYAFERTKHWLEPLTAQPVAAAQLPNGAGPVTAAASPSLPQEATSTVREPSTMSTQQATNGSRTPRLVDELKRLFEQASGIDFGTTSADANFLEAGVDSLLVTQLATKVKNTYKVNVSFRQLMEELSTFTLLAKHLDQNLPAEAAPAPVAAAPAAAAPAAVATAAAPVAAAPQFALPQPMAFAPVGGGNNLAMTQLLQLQMAQLTLLQQQLALVAGGSMLAAPAVAAPVVAAPAPAPAPVAAPAPAPAAAAAAPAEANGSTEGVEKGQITYDVKKAFGAIARIHKQSDAMTPKQLARLEQLTQRYVGKTGKSKAHTQEYRHCHADPRVVTGFKPRIKEIIYPIVSTRSEGCRLWDLDGNEYVDALNGFGSNYFGYANKRINAAMQARMEGGAEIGPQTPLAGQSAKLVCELTGMDRAGFCNTGSEAVMGALRIARTVTGRGLVVAFSGSYHGIFDEVIVRDTKNLRSIPAAPGIMAEAVANILVLEYGTDETLRIIRERADEIAAVLVEPVQSRRPDFQPRAFLHEVRKITKESGSALIFDEVITGFRVHPGGAQVYYGIEADLTTYGKIVGGGMPIGVVAGRNPWMDALDGGQWQYGDASIPTAGVTYFAGTFVRHPLSMAAVHEALLIMKENGPALQESINARTTAMANELNAFFKSVGAPVEIRHFSSLWKTFFTEPQPYGELLFCYLRDRGVHIWDGFPCFITMAHGDAEVAYIVKAFKESVREMQAGEFLPGGEASASLDANQPPVAGARLGRDQQGNPAWFVPHPETPGKYVQVS
ncbi:MAG TPA: amino acid adenylation domain-containing protein [Polyangiaceae bacterium]|nr:amino acid adenylation domain-containing protein [Polyangiaceae bacterium]